VQPRKERRLTEHGINSNEHVIRGTGVESDVPCSEQEIQEINVVHQQNEGCREKTKNRLQKIQRYQNRTISQQTSSTTDQ